MQRRLRRVMAQIESLDPESTLLDEYRVFVAVCLNRLRQVRADYEWASQQEQIFSPTQRKHAAHGVQLVSLVESEFCSDADTAH